MANSGEILGNNVTVSSPHVARFRIEWQLASQNVGGNYSTINWQAYIDFFGCDAQLDNGHVNSNAGTLYSNGGRVYNYAGNFSNHTVTMGSGSFNIGHNNDGTQSLSMNGSIDIYQSGTSSGSGSWSLPTIPRYANITGYSMDQVTDVGFRINVSVDNTCNLLEYSLDNGATFTAVGGSYTSKSVTVGGNLPSGASYNVVVRVTRADSGLTTTSGAIGVTTLLQSNFAGIDPMV